MTFNSDVADEEDDAVPEIGGREINYGIPWMICFQLAAICVYLFCLDAQNRNDMEMANCWIPMLFAGLCGVIVIARLRRNPILLWTPITWFIAISTMAFGIGPLIYFFGSDIEIRELDKFWVMDGAALLRTNLLNAVGTLFVCIAHSFASLLPWKPNSRTCSHSQVESMSKKILFYLLPITLGLKWFVIVPMYFGALDFVVPGVVANFGHLVGVCILLAFYLWQRGDRRYAPLALFLFASEMGAALLIFGKFYFIMPFVQAAFGCYLAKPHIRVLAVGFVLMAAAYMWAKPLVDLGRTSNLSEETSLKDRVELVKSYISENKSHDFYEHHSSEHWWSRQSYASIQAYLMNAYDTGHIGNSIRYFWAVFIPRSLWPDKPLMNRFGTELNNEIFGNELSSLAATIYGEAYWNGGWLLVMIISSFIAVVFYVVGRYSVHFMRVPDFRWLPVGLMGIIYGLSVEFWFVTVFLGTIPLFIATWYLMKILFPLRNDQ